jgi:hypothetical protein
LSHAASENEYRGGEDRRITAVLEIKFVPVGADAFREKDHAGNEKGHAVLRSCGRSHDENVSFVPEMFMMN